MVTIAARLAALEARRPRQVQGYHVMRRRADGTIAASVVSVGRELFATPEAFHARYPTGVITRALIVLDDGRTPDPGSLMSQWFPSETTS